MGLLTTEQKASIAAGSRIAQLWSVYVPADTAHSTFEERIFHNGLTGTVEYVVRAGRRKYVAVNFSPVDRRKLQAVRHAFIVRNEDRTWYPGVAGNWWLHSGGYQAKPQECRIRHRCLVWGITSLAWLELTCIDFLGQVVKCEPTVAANAAGVLVGDAVTIQADAIGAWDVLRREWTKDDSYDTDSGTTAPDSIDFVMLRENGTHPLGI